MGSLWKDAFQHVVGKRIQGVVVAERDSAPHTQVFLIFEDGTYYELYGQISGRNDIDVGPAERVRDYVGSRIVLDVQSKVGS